MMPRIVLPCALGAALWSCGNSPQEGGGFETSDIQALVVSPSGQPVAGARAWLVRSAGDSAPARVLDSSITDSNGRIHFDASALARSGLGIDVQAGSWMAMAPRELEARNSLTIPLSESGTISSSADSSRAFPILFVPGSHFSSVPSASGSSAVLHLPQGTWKVAVRTGSTSLVWDSVRVQALPLVLQIQDAVAQGPDIALDSFQVHATVFRTRSVTNLAEWSRISGVVDSFRYASGSMDADSGGDSFDISPDTTLEFRGIAGGIQRGMGFRVGSLAVSFDSSDISRYGLCSRILSLQDSNGTRIVLKLDSASEFGPSTLSLSDRNTPIPADDTLPTRLPGFFHSTTWYFTWFDNSVLVSNSSGWSTSIPTAFASAPVFTFLVRPARRSIPPTTIHLRKVRLYSP